MRTMLVGICGGLVLLLASGLTARTVEGDPDSRTVEVRDLQVEFLPGNKVRVRGRLQCRGIRYDPYLVTNAWSSAAVRVDFPHGEKGFSLLPCYFLGRSTQPGSKHVPYWGVGKTKYVQGQTDVPVYGGVVSLGAAAFDMHLDDDEHNGRWLPFDKTLNFDRVQAKDRPRYRVVIDWTLHSTGSEGEHFQHDYTWIVYGPYDWGSAPPCHKVLKANHRSQTLFNESGVKTVEPEPSEKLPLTDGKVEGDEPPVEDGEKERPMLVRPSRPPTQLEAVDAANALKVTLDALPGVEGVGVGLPPRMALVQVTHVADLEPEAVARLTARVALETACAAPWVDTVRISISGGKRSSSATVTWAALVAYAAGKTTVQEFCATWETGGDKLEIPE